MLLEANEKESPDFLWAIYNFPRGATVLQTLVEIGVLGISGNFFGSKLGAKNEIADTAPILIKNIFLSVQNGDFSSPSSIEINVVGHGDGVQALGFNLASVSIC